MLAAVAVTLRVLYLLILYTSLYFLFSILSDRFGFINKSLRTFRQNRMSKANESWLHRVHMKYTQVRGVTQEKQLIQQMNDSSWRD